jgi:hypothetical protein
LTWISRDLPAVAYPHRQGIPRPQSAPDYKFKVFISGQKRGVTPQIKRQLRRRSAVEPVIGAPRTEPTHTRAALIDRATY